MKRHLLDSSPSDGSQQLPRSNKPSKQALVRKAKQELTTNSKRLSTIAEEMKGLIETIKDLAEDDDLSDGLVGTKRRRAEK
jgi:predicted  nucleic acid-binding Zn-ribbon protein